MKLLLTNGSRLEAREVVNVMAPRGHDVVITDAVPDPAASRTRWRPSSVQVPEFGVGAADGNEGWSQAIRSAIERLGIDAVMPAGPEVVGFANQVPHAAAVMPLAPQGVWGHLDTPLGTARLLLDSGVPVVPWRAGPDSRLVRDAPQRWVTLVQAVADRGRLRALHVAGVRMSGVGEIPSAIETYDSASALELANTVADNLQWHGCFSVLVEGAERHGPVKARRLWPWLVAPAHAWHAGVDLISRTVALVRPDLIALPQEGSIPDRPADLGAMTSFAGMGTVGARQSADRHEGDVAYPDDLVVTRPGLLTHGLARAADYRAARAAVEGTSARRAVTRTRLGAFFHRGVFAHSTECVFLTRSDIPAARALADHLARTAHQHEKTDS